MPSLHFATSLMAALLLAEVGPLAGALGFGYAATLGFALVYLGEHYVVDLVAGAALTASVRRLGPKAAPVLGRIARGMGHWRNSRTQPAEGGDGQQRDGAWRAAGGRPDLERDLSSFPVAAEEEMPRVRLTRRQVVAFGIFILSAVGFLYFVLPKLAGVGTTVHRIERGNSWWIAVGVVLEVLSFGGYVVLFRSVFSERRRAYRLA